MLWRKTYFKDFIFLNYRLFTQLRKMMMRKESSKICLDKLFIIYCNDDVLRFLTFQAITLILNFSLFIPKRHENYLWTQHFPELLFFFLIFNNFRQLEILYLHIENSYQLPWGARCFCKTFLQLSRKFKSIIFKSENLRSKFLVI